MPSVMSTVEAICTLADETRLPGAVHAAPAREQQHEHRERAHQEHGHEHVAGAVPFVCDHKDAHEHGVGGGEQAQAARHARGTAQTSMSPAVMASIVCPLGAEFAVDE